MICENCGKDYSEKVWRIHRTSCRKVEVEQAKKVDVNSMTYQELQSYYAEKTGNVAIGKKKADMIAELKEVN